VPSGQNSPRPQGTRPSRNIFFSATPVGGGATGAGAATGGGVESITESDAEEVIVSPVRVSVHVILRSILPCVVGLRVYTRGFPSEINEPAEIPESGSELVVWHSAPKLEVIVASIGSPVTVLFLLSVMPASREVELIESLPLLPPWHVSVYVIGSVMPEG